MSRRRPPGATLLGALSLRSSLLTLMTLTLVWPAHAAASLGSTHNSIYYCFYAVGIGLESR